nr:MAG TPA: NYN ribonuclease and ATPase [Bacteriophage sp.]
MVFILEYTLFLDTNALLTLQKEAFKEPFVISQKTLEEIENIKTSARKDGEVKYQARAIARLLKEHVGMYTVVPTTKAIKDIIENLYLDETPDNIILAAASYYNENTSPIIVCTDDLNCSFISSNVFNLPTKSVTEINLVKNIDEYKGYKDVTLSDEEMSYFYLHTKENIYDSILNEYLIIRKSDGEVVDYRKWNGEEYVVVSYKTINSHYMGKIKPRNPHQVLAFNMLQDKDVTIKVISGKFGSGKDYLMIANALKLIDEGKFDKLLYIRNAIGVKDANELGFLPGSKLEKLLPYAMPLADHLGGETGLEMQMMAGTIEVEHLGYIRGRDIKNTIIYVSEAENLTKEHVQLLIGRVGEGSALWINGDFKQTDSALFRMNNGLMSTVQKLAGHEKFGYVQLQKTERSETAAMADLLD